MFLHNFHFFFFVSSSPEKKIKVSEIDKLAVKSEIKDFLVQEDVKSEQNALNDQEKLREQNRIRQLAFKLWQKLPKDYETFCKVASHLYKNAHRYGNTVNEIVAKPEPECKLENIVVKKEEIDVKQEQLDDAKQEQLRGGKQEELTGMKTEVMDPPKEINKQLRTIQSLKKKNRIREQQQLVAKLKSSYGSYRSISNLAGIALKTVHQWCSKPKIRVHKGKARAAMKKNEFTNFLMQDTMTYSNPGKRYSGKKFLMYTWKEVYRCYLQQPEYHKNGQISRSSMRVYCPKNVLLSGQTPVNQCLCDYCENCDLLI